MYPHLKPMIYLYHGSEKCKNIHAIPQMWLYIYHFDTLDQRKVCWINLILHT